MTVPSLYIYNLASYCKKNLEDFVKNKDRYANMQMITRGGDLLRTPYYSQTKSQKGPYYRGVKIYNSLPVEIRQTDSFDVFGKKLKNFLIESCFYSYEEFLQSCGRE